MYKNSEMLIAIILDGNGRGRRLLGVVIQPTKR